MAAFFLLRMNDHLQYLNKVKATLDGKGDFRGSDYHKCKFGLWLYGDGPNEVADMPAEAKPVFESIFEPHQRFHDASHQALEFHDAGDSEHAKEKMTEMHHLSNELVGKLLQLDRLATRK